MVKLNFTDVQESSPLEPLPDGRYTVVVTGGEEDRVREESFNAGAPLFKWEFTVNDGKYNGQKVWDNMVVAEPDEASGRKGTLWRVKQLLTACGMDTEGEIEFDVDDVIGSELEIQVAVRPERTDEETGKTFRASNRVTRFIKPSSGLQTNAEAKSGKGSAKKDAPALR